MQMSINKKRLVNLKKKCVFSKSRISLLSYFWGNGSHDIPGTIFCWFHSFPDPGENGLLHFSNRP